MPAEAMAKLRAQYPQYDDIPDRQLAAKIVDKYPQYHDLLGDIAGGPADPYLRGIPQEPGAPGPTEQVTGRPPSVGELATAAISAPLAMGGGALAAKVGIPAVLGRVGAMGALGAGRAASKGDDPMEGAFLDALVAGLTEGVGSLAASGGKVPGTQLKIGLKEWGAPARAFRWATEAPEKALKMVEDRLPQAARLNVPSISDKPISVTEGVKKLASMTKEAYQIARAEIGSEMKRLDIQKFIATPSGEFVKGPSPSAGAIFKKYTSPDRFSPSGFAKLSETVRGALTGPQGKAVADAFMTTPMIGGVALGPLLIAAFAPSMARHIPGARELIEAEEGGGRRGF